MTVRHISEARSFRTTRYTLEALIAQMVERYGPPTAYGAHGTKTARRLVVSESDYIRCVEAYTAIGKHGPGPGDYHRLGFMLPDGLLVIERAP